MEQAGSVLDAPAQAPSMSVFVIGATGYIGSNVSRRLIEAGHKVTGFARSPEAEAKLEGLGIKAFRGDVADVEHLVSQAQKADVTIFAPQLMMQEESDTVRALLDGLKDTGKAFIFTSGTGVLSQRTSGDWSEDTFAEDDPFTPNRSLVQRVETETMVRNAAGPRLRAMVIRPGVIWGHEMRGHAARIQASVKETGAACYIGAGLNLYSNIHVDDLAEIYRLAVEKGVAGALYHAISGEVCNRVLAETVAKKMGVQTRSITMDEAIEIWGKFSTLIVMGVCSRSRAPRTRRELGWTPKRLDWVADIDNYDLLA